MSTVLPVPQPPLAEILERVSDAFVALDADWRYTYVNAKAAALFGRTPEELIGRHIWTEFPEGVGQPFHRAYERAMREQTPITLEEYYPPYDRWFENRIYPSPRGLTIYFSDITERRQIEAALRENRSLLARIVETDANGIAVVDTAGTITFANPAAERIAGLPAGSMAGRSYAALAPTPLRVDGRRLPEEAHPFREVLRTGRPVYDVQLAVERSDGRRVALSVNAAPLVDDTGTLTGVVLTISDVTERTRAEEQVRVLATALRGLTARAQKAREQEATRIARELHDELGQALTGIKIDLAWLDTRLSRVAGVADSLALRERTAAAVRQVDATIHTVRRLSSELRPGILDDLGIVAAVEWQAEEFATRTGIACAAAVRDGAVEVDQARATALYRILQEALTNVVRHADATRVDITLATGTAGLTLDVCDNGRGIAVELANSPRSIGLLGMRERAGEHGGTVTIAPVAPHGTRVHVEMPV
ncbi:MAG: hypothetical protein A3I61_00065 [Acidobacteria bacterium RIFCSPLOWO2_02_FULL_68_18]|nr:MAG: hypothetical protein A3I61_00065 [Acidobacteria bacterium RIFCSPLOWO2_02_FULL_68_18]OFW51274.1 MAG: hypothetical protein A3G77_05460 [Acidobacteria bacterium RIFCSPLOWO2_12_FULL_68_19]